MRKIVLFIFLLSTVTFQALAQNQNSVEGDRQALVDLYNATNGDNWSNNSGWLSGNPSNDWYGVEVDSDGRVVKLDLYKNNLRGDLPESIGNLTKLQFFSVKRNPIYSEIPKSIENWAEAEIILLSSGSDYNVVNENTYNEHGGKQYSHSIAKYHGTIPDVFDQMPNLRMLELAWSPDLDLQPFPSTLYQHSKLEVLNLAGTMLTGELNDDFNLPELKLLFLGKTRLSGKLPSTWGLSTKLINLKIGHTDAFLNETGITERFSGSLPDSFANLKKIKYFMITNQDIGGEIPGFIIENWSSLRQINLQNNQFTGTIPKEFGDFDLVSFNVERNNFTGELHPNLVSGMQRVIIFSVSSNNLTGEIPNGQMVDGEWKGWRTKQRLRTIRFTDNNFTGPLPDMPEYVGDMSMVHFHRNNFTGGIPDTWEELFTPSLRNQNPNRTFDNLQIRGNDLQGELPEWFTNENIDGSVDVKGNRWTHRDILENGVNVNVGEDHDAPQLPFGYHEEFVVPEGVTFEFDYSHRVHSSDQVQWTKNGSPISGGKDGILVINDISEADAGTYRLELTNSKSGLPATVVSEPIELRVGEGSQDSDKSPSAPNLVSPSNNTDGVSVSPTLDWNSSTSAESYRIEVASDSGFENVIVNDNGLTVTEKTLSGLEGETTYYWRVRAMNSSGESNWSSVWSFATENVNNSGGGNGKGPQKSTPEKGDDKVSKKPTFKWNKVEETETYELEVMDAETQELLIDEIVADTSYTPGKEFQPNHKYQWRVRAIANGELGEWGDTWEFMTAEELAFEVEVEQNYPNPFNPSTNIRFNLAEQQEVSLKVYDMTGRLVATLINSEMLGNGTHSASFDAGNLASGIYFYRLITPGEIVTRKMTLMK